MICRSFSNGGCISQPARLHNVIASILFTCWEEKNYSRRKFEPRSNFFLPFYQSLGRLHSYTATLPYTLKLLIAVLTIWDSFLTAVSIKKPLIYAQTAGHTHSTDRLIWWVAALCVSNTNHTHTRLQLIKSTVSDLLSVHWRDQRVLFDCCEHRLTIRFGVRMSWK